MNKLYRSRRDKKVTGLCGGLAEMMNVDATLLRVLLVITVFFTGGAVIFIYLLAALVIPKEPGFDQPPYDPYAGSNGRQAYNGNGWQQHRPHTGPAANPYNAASAYETGKTNNIDEMMKDIEKKALQKEVEELRAKVARYEIINDTNKKDV